jgi:hypothetical protein
MYEWSGTCCSFATRDADDGGDCQLTVDGPGSTCTWKEKGKENYFNVVIEEGNDRYCPKSSLSAFSRRPGPSNFTTCVSGSFRSCLATCTILPTFRQSFKACSAQDSTQALRCAAGAVSVCSEVGGGAPVFLCQQLDDMFSSGALPTQDCHALQDKCAAHGVTETACT